MQKCRVHGTATSCLAGKFLLLQWAVWLWTLRFRVQGSDRNLARHGSVLRDECIDLYRRVRIAWRRKRCPHTAYIYLYMLSWLFRFNRLSFKLRSMGVRNLRSRRLSMCCFLLFFGWELFRAKATCVLEFPSTKPVGCVILCTASCLAQARKGPSVHRLRMHRLCAA